MNRSVWKTMLVSLVAGAAVWALSPWLAGQREPWDAGGFYYIIALLVAGAIAGFVSPRPLWAHYLGGLIGQVGYAILFVDVSPLFVVGVIFLLAYTLIFLVGAAIAGQLRAFRHLPGS
jgi:hypothetical protein